MITTVGSDELRVSDKDRDMTPMLREKDDSNSTVACRVVEISRQLHEVAHSPIAFDLFHKSIQAYNPVASHCVSMDHRLRVESACLLEFESYSHILEILMFAIIWSVYYVAL